MRCVTMKLIDINKYQLEANCISEREKEREKQTDRQTDTQN